MKYSFFCRLAILAFTVTGRMAFYNGYLRPLENAGQPKIVKLQERSSPAKSYVHYPNFGVISKIETRDQVPVLRERMIRSSQTGSKKFPKVKILREILDQVDRVRRRPQPYMQGRMNSMLNLAPTPFNTF